MNKGRVLIGCSVQVGAKCLETGVYGAYYNVMTNLGELKDEEFKTKVKADVEAELKAAQEGCAEVLSILEGRSE